MPSVDYLAELPLSDLARAELRGIPKNLMFDLFGTLVTERGYCECYVDAFGRHIGLDELEAVSVAEFGTRDATIERFRRYFNLNGDRAKMELFLKMVEAWASSVDFLPGVEEVLHELKNRGHRIAILSNTNIFSARAVELLRHRLDPVAHYIHLSHEHKRCKPHIEAFRMCMVGAGFMPHETAMIGNELDRDVEPAMRCRIRTGIVVMPQEQLAAEHLARRNAETPTVTHRRVYHVPHIRSLLTDEFP